MSKFFASGGEMMEWKTALIESLRSTTRPAQRRSLETKEFAKQNKNYE